MKKIVVSLVAAMVLLSVGLAGAEERPFDLLYLGKNGDEHMYQVTARRTDTIQEVMYGREVEYAGYGNAIASAIQKIAKNHVIKNVIPITYARHPDGTIASGETKRVIIFAIPKDAGK
jgi:hypothetical protein